MDVIRDTSDLQRWTVPVAARADKVRMCFLPNCGIQQERFAVFGGEHEVDVDLSQ
jgi:hypothetical protein